MAAEHSDERDVRTHAVAGALTRPLLRADAAELIAREWSALYDDAAEKNPFFAPWSLMPALKEFADADVRLACARGEDGALIGLAPLVARRVYAHLPLRFAEVWRHRFAFYGAPLLRRGKERQAAEGLLHAAEKMPSRPDFLRLTHLDAAATVAAAFAASPRRVAYRSDQSERAVLRAASGLAPMSAKRRSELRRRGRKLAEEGGLALRRLADASELSSWTEDFLALERAGWKGEARTALADCAHAAAFFRATVTSAFDAGALHFVRLDTPRATVAMAANFLSGGEGYGFKICFNEDYAKYSPGVLLVAEITEALQADGEFSFFDSCASADHPWTKELWSERRTLIGLNVSLRGAAGAASLSGARAVEEGARWLRSAGRRSGDGARRSETRHAG